ncbi:glycosyltransferase family 1 protein [Sulfitobacter sp. F26204]|uniref:glycosyltransferase family 4 protein n=1 Tax=Sulfitobacter sp. F26204 TaxID=2996014 RepID=UPI00225DEAA0|nr:glycosyltransferase family 1 protein [Sulfitobacter sp. F26204]MCX7558309.1 glycosyltransferase family 1 protein [Sulfitobacter sp. F26204]
MITARLLDLTRSLRRTGRMATGVDRVERAYLDHFINEEIPAFGLMRTALGYVLLDQEGLIAFQQRLNGDLEWGPVDALSRFSKGRDQALMQAESDVRRQALARCLPMRLRRMLQRQLPAGFAYYNTGHSNLTERVLNSVKYASGTIDVLIHDVIPLEYPEYQTPNTVDPFRDKMKRVQRLADRVIYNSQDTRCRTENVMRNWGKVPAGIVAHLGTIVPDADPATIPSEMQPTSPYFITVGTIEPRKNHVFLLDLWERLGPDAPLLLICGSRGWNNKVVFDRLDGLQKNARVREIAGLDDGALAALVQGSAGLLFPSHAEGFGLPPIEALLLGTRVLCNDLTVLREILGEQANFAPVSEPELWLKTIQSWKNAPPTANKDTNFVGPNWTDHFKTVLRLR